MFIASTLVARRALALLLSTAACAAALLASPPAFAKPLRWASQGDVQSFDPHAYNSGLNNQFNAFVYEGLVTYDQQFNIEPALAASWTQPEPTRWRFELRPNVVFHDGTPFTADDVVFSFERAQAPSSNFRVLVTGITAVRKLSPTSVEFVLAAPNPVLLRQIVGVRILSKSWAAQHQLEKPQNFAQKEETHAVRHANGTGPFVLKSSQPGIKTELVQNPRWWGRLNGNVTEIVYTPIAADATRLAALLSGEIDFVLDPAPQDVPKLRNTAGVKVVEGVESRTIFLGLDQASDELAFSNVKGRNPFKDLRVRQALYQAIDIEALKRVTLRGLSLPAGSYVAPQAEGYTADGDRRLPYDPARARALLAEAGYPNGFEITLDCPNDRYLNDEEICKALTSFFTKVGVQTRLNSQGSSTYFPKLQRRESSLHLLGWGVATFDALYSLQALVHTPGGSDGSWNFGRYSNARVDALIDAAKVEGDVVKRRALLVQSLKLAQDDVALIPLHHQISPWAARGNVQVAHRANNQIDLRWVRID
jgi:peptide/nickel transport system substrate-binding protein